MEIFGFYIRIGDYYTYKKAENKINESSYSKTEKTICLDILKGVSIYKGVGSTYLIWVKIMNTNLCRTKTLSTANKYLRMLRNGLGINYNNRIRTASNFFMPGGMVMD